MSWESEFESQWKIFLDVVETCIRREIDRNKKLDSELINSIIHSQVNNWSIGTHYNGAWLGNLKRKHPSLGEEFQAALEELRLSNNIAFNFSLPRFRLSEVIVIAWALALILILTWLREAILRQILGTAFVAAIAYPIFLNLRDSKKKKAVESCLEQIQKELEFTGQKLKNVATRADEANL
ncbi:MAG: hypothetical protein F6K40_06255 [Okeania sp. SIO3I5]|uniref:hypothetical protein n=1 Tax=Okeania sp. SIO3I5 TaxID=2607805 RepID=UPI0013B92A00|nr:hypothetical protein [Okeania sp. SIO3I5]NEQ35909.1 hypothetical protein [Okeania sp. SIO3I5]